jgi:hypothetical protein
MKVIKPPERHDTYYPKSVFLAGSIEMGLAEDWQARAEELLKDTNWTVLNPRRDDWDSSWTSSIDNPQFVEQVEWELDHLKLADKVIFYFVPDTSAPITLLELGGLAMSQPKKCCVVCPQPYWKKGNVDVVCKKYGVKQVETLEEAVQWLK